MTETMGSLNKIEQTPISELQPYERNARVITDQSIKSVADSIQRFGFVQPIVADSQGVILAGHTRLEAAKLLGLTEVPVMRSEHLTEAQAAEFRLVDNKTSEMTAWDHNALVMELREFEDGLREEYFPDIDLQIEQTTAMQVSDDDLRDVEEKVLQISQGDPLSKHETGVKCPSCFYVFKVRTKSLPGVTWDDLNALVHGDE